VFIFTFNARVRPSPFHDATIAAGVTSFQQYNYMLLPSSYGDPDAEYDRLLNGAALWDVAVERQIELAGPDAAALAQILCPRDLERCQVGQGKYVALCNHAGVLINDPILLKIDDDRYWLSIADSNILFWARAIAAERRLNVTVSEPDVSPLAVQGPLAENVVAAVFGDWVRDLKYFWFADAAIDGIPVKIARSGWSKQGGFEIYLMDGSRGTDLWNIMMEAGRPWEIGPGCPNTCERIESGLLSWGADTDDTTNPFEVRMTPYVDLDVPDEVVGIDALRRVWSDGPKRHQLGLVQDEAPRDFAPVWRRIFAHGHMVGHQTNGVWSRRLDKSIGFALISTDCVPGDTVDVERDGGMATGTLVELPFL